MLISSSAFGAAMGMEDFNNSDGIVTPNIATGVIRTERFAVDTNGSMVYCPTNFDYTPRNNTCTDGSRNGWTLLKDSVPHGKTFVGFKSVSGSYGSHRLEIYWK
jgi:hypothetical protein